MKSILISIKPEYVEKIFNGTKKYEYRTKICKEKIDKLIIYSTSPVMKVVGEVEVLDKLEDTRDRLWEKTNDYSGIESKKDFDNYFKHPDKAYCYALGKVTKYKMPKNLQDYGVKAAPQSFIYI